MNRGDKIKFISALGAIGLSVVFFVWLRPNGEPQAYFYDLSAKELFSALETAVPPIRGVDGPEEDGVRAAVVSPTGDCKDKKSRKIVYLERFSPELKKQYEAMRLHDSDMSKVTVTVPRGAVSAHTFIGHPDQTNWFPSFIAEASALMTRWKVRGVSGKYPIICVP